MPAPRMPMTRSADPGGQTHGLYRLLAWASPSFPTGAFSYSHGLEAAVTDGTVRDRASLQAWIAAVVGHGAGRLDADTLRDAYRAAEAGDLTALDAANRRGLAYRATAELALESAQQGEAVLATCRAAWPDPFISKWCAGTAGVSPASATATPAVPSESGCHSAVFGAVAARTGIALEDALLGYLHAFASNLVSAGIRLGVIGQTDGQRILAVLEPVVAEAADAAPVRDSADFGAATFAVDLASMAHETQYSRLFRS